MLGCATKDETQAAIKKRIAKIRRQKMLLNLMTPSLGKLRAGWHAAKTPSASGKNLGAISAAQWRGRLQNVERRSNG
jgi:hypothetical protein